MFAQRSSSTPISEGTTNIRPTVEIREAQYIPAERLERGFRGRVTHDSQLPANSPNTSPTFSNRIGREGVTWQSEKAKASVKPLGSNLYPLQTPCQRSSTLLREKFHKLSAGCGNPRNFAGHLNHRLTNSLSVSHSLQASIHVREWTLYVEIFIDSQ